MNEKFFDLPEERQNTIINAALHVFAKYEYKKASTDEIAATAGISKGLIFHYFESKKGLYLYLYKYSERFIIEEMGKLHDYAETDFFEILVNAQMCKAAILVKHPDIMTFIAQLCFEENEEIKDEVGASFNSIVSSSAERFMERADKSKFKDDVRAEKVMNIILWMSDGFMRSKAAVWHDNLIELNNEYLEYIELLRKQFYKPEYL